MVCTTPKNHGIGLDPPKISGMGLWMFLTPSLTTEKMATTTKFVSGDFFICGVFFHMGKNPLFYLANPRLMGIHVTPLPKFTTVK